MTASASLLPPGEGGAKRRMRARQLLAEQLYYKLTAHALIRPSGTFSQWEKETELSSNCA